MRTGLQGAGADPATVEAIGAARRGQVGELGSPVGVIAELNRDD